MSESPDISVVIPSYNPGKLLLRSLRSALKQTYQDFEIIIVDDGSQDKSSDFVKELQLDNLYYYRLEHQNANVARNYGILHSKGKYIALLDADDEWFRNHLEVNMELMKTTECDGIYSSIEMRTPHKNTVFKARQLNKGEKMINYLLSKGIGASSSTLFMKKEAAGDILWDESLKRHQDYDFVVRFSQKYRWIANEEVTAACYLNYDPKKQIDFDSCIRFIEKNKKDIAPEIFSLYHSQMYNLAVNSGADKRIVTYYKNNSGRYSSQLKKNYKRFAVVTRSRTGSNLLISLLNSHKNIRAHGEMFSRLNGKSCEEIYNGIFPDKSAWQCVGFKIFYCHPQDSDDNTIWELMRNDRNLKIIHLQRENMLRVHISRLIAGKNDIWCSNRDSSSTVVDKKVYINIDELIEDFKRTENFIEGTREKFKDHPVIEVKYEELIANREDIMDTIIKFLGVPQVPLQSDLKRQNPEKIRDLVLNYSELHDALIKTKYAFMLEE